MQVPGKEIWYNHFLFQPDIEKKRYSWSKPSKITLTIKDLPQQCKISVSFPGELTATVMILVMLKNKRQIFTIQLLKIATFKQIIKSLLSNAVSFTFYYLWPILRNHLLQKCCAIIHHIISMALNLP